MSDQSCSLIGCRIVRLSYNRVISDNRWSSDGRLLYRYANMFKLSFVAYVTLRQLCCFYGELSINGSDIGLYKSEVAILDLDLEKPEYYWLLEYWRQLCSCRCSVDHVAQGNNCCNVGVNIWVWVNNMCACKFALSRLYSCIIFFSFTILVSFFFYAD